MTAAPNDDLPWYAESRPATSFTLLGRQLLRLTSFLNLVCSSDACSSENPAGGLANSLLSVYEQVNLNLSVPSLRVDTEKAKEGGVSSS